MGGAHGGLLRCELQVLNFQLQGGKSLRRQQPAWAEAGSSAAAHRKNHWPWGRGSGSMSLKPGIAAMRASQAWMCG